MKLHKLLSHTADIRLQIEGTTLEELFESALEGMASIIKKSKSKNQSEFQSQEIIKKINIRSQDNTSLLIDFLSEALTYSQEERAVFRKIIFEDIDDKLLEAEIYGETVNDFDEDVKAVTYHEAEIKKNKKGNYETVIIFDV